MPDLTPKQRRRGQTFADQVALLAVDAPDTESKKDIYRAVNAIRKRYGLTPDGKRREILRVIGLGASKVSDIVNETGMPVAKVYEVIRILVDEHPPVIRRETIEATGGNGRPTEQFFPVNGDRY